jgi:hypothetical protein
MDSSRSCGKMVSHVDTYTILHIHIHICIHMHIHLHIFIHVHVNNVLNIHIHAHIKLGANFSKKVLENKLTEPTLYKCENILALLALLEGSRALYTT